MRRRSTWVVVALVTMGLVGGGLALAGKRPGPRPPDCRFVLCAYPDCLPGEHTEIPPGQCCPVCVPN